MRVKVCGMSSARGRPGCGRPWGVCTWVCVLAGQPAIRRRGTCESQSFEPCRRLSPPWAISSDQPQADVNAVADRVGLGAVQLHGNETPESCEGIARRVIRAIGLAETTDISSILEWPSSVTLLVDAYDPEKHGGTGRPVNWTVAARVASRRPTILSGGLRAENVVTAITTVRPYAIDVSSGVEERPGVKGCAASSSVFRGCGRSGGAEAVKRDRS